jgi:hypothetical protein
MVQGKISAQKVQVQGSSPSLLTGTGKIGFRAVSHSTLRDDAVASRLLCWAPADASKSSCSKSITLTSGACPYSMLYNKEVGAFAVGRQQFVAAIDSLKSSLKPFLFLLLSFFRGFFVRIGQFQ